MSQILKEPQALWLQTVKEFTPQVDSRVAKSYHECTSVAIGSQNWPSFTDRFGYSIFYIVNTLLIKATTKQKEKKR